MHDDNDGDDDELDKIYHSGITPDADRAEYALSRGQSALQYGPAEFEPEVATPTRRRVLFLGLGLGIAATSVGYAALGRFTGQRTDRPRPSAPTPVRHKRPEWANHLIEGSQEAAKGPIRDLVQGYPTFVMVVEAYGGSDAKLWAGMQRLVTFAELDRSKKGYEIAKRMLDSFEINPPPRHLRRMSFDLEELVRIWEKANR